MAAKDHPRPERDNCLLISLARRDGEETLYLHGGALASAMSPICSVVR